MSIFLTLDGAKVEKSLNDGGEFFSRSPFVRRIREIKYRSHYIRRDQNANPRLGKVRLGAIQKL